MTSIENLLSARLFIFPRVVGDRLYFLSNMGQGGHLSLYALYLQANEVPQPLLPPRIALQNPELLDGEAFIVFPALGKILLFLDQNGDEHYQPMVIPMEGGIPEPAFGDTLKDYRVRCVGYDLEQNIVYLNAESVLTSTYAAYQANLATGRLLKLAESKWGSFPTGFSSDHKRVAIVDGYSFGDSVVWEWTSERPIPTRLAGVPLEERQPGQTVPLTSFGAVSYTPGDKAILLGTSLFEDTYGLALLTLDEQGEVELVEITGQQHQGVGEFSNFRHLKDDLYALEYNIDGCSWLYEGRFDETARHLKLERVLCGSGKLTNGKLESFYYNKADDRYALAFSTATSPCQLYTIEGTDRQTYRAYTQERILGIQTEWLAPGEDASFTSHDGLRISARLYLPATTLGFEGPRPLVYYVHGGPQGQERPDFTWFSMPLIQFLTLNGFAVFVPNARGSLGYGLNYTKRVDHDWGGQDRLDHVWAMTKILPNDARVDVSRAGVVGRSYGGYMTLTLASRHPELWAAAVDMFGTFDMLTWAERVPESWKAYIAEAIGDPVKDRDFLIERSPSTYIENITCPLLVIQGQNDPRVVESESRDLVERLRQGGKAVDYLLFEDEGHDVLKFANRVRCYEAIRDWFKQNL